MKRRRLSPQSTGFVVMLAAITGLGPLGIDTSLPALPLMAHALQTSDGIIQATLGSFMLAFAGGQLVVGPLADRYGRRPIVIGGIAIFAVAGLLCAGATNAFFLVAARFLAGLGACAGAVAARAIIRDLFTDRAAATRMQGYTSAISGVVPMLAPLLGAALLPLGWRAIYAGLVIGGSLLLIATLTWLPESLMEPLGADNPTRVRAIYGRFLRLPRSIALCVLVASSFAGLFAFISGSPFVLVRELGFSSTQFGIAFAISASSILTGSWIAGSLAHRLGSERLLRLACIGAAIAGVAAFAANISTPHGPSATTFIAVMAGYAFTFGLIAPGAFAAGMEHAGRMAGVAAGTLGAMQMLGGAVGSTVNGLLPFASHVDIGLSAGIAGASTLGAYIWSTRGIAGAARIGLGETCAEGST